MSFTLVEVAELVGGEVVGDPDLPLSGISSLAEARPGDISFLANQAYVGVLAQTKASAVLVAERQECSPAQVVVENPDWAFAKVVGKWGPQPRPLPPGIHPSAVIGDDCVVGDDVRIGPHAYIGDGCRIGDHCTIHAQVHLGSDCSLGSDCVLYPHVVVRERCRIDDRVLIHPGVVIGADGFGYASLEGVHHKIPQVGIVHIESDVEIGANTTIDRARFGVTRIGAGTKIDNLVQIAHNVQIGPHCIIVAQSGIAGTTTLGRHVTIAGQSGLIGHLKIGDESMVAAQSGVTKNLPKGAVVMGSPACDMKVHKEREVAVRRLGRTVQTVKQLEHRLAELESRLAELDGKAAP